MSKDASAEEINDVDSIHSNLFAICEPEMPTIAAATRMFVVLKDTTSAGLSRCVNPYEFNNLALPKNP
jgi:hypothetical protein